VRTAPLDGVWKPVTGIVTFGLPELTTWKPSKIDRLRGGWLVSR